MSRPFVITAATNTVSLNNNRQGGTSFTVSNTGTQPVRGRVYVVAQSATAQAWLQLLGEAERDFAGQGSQQYVVQIAVPPGASAGEYTFRLDIVDVAEPDESLSEGPTVKFVVPLIAPPARKPFPWWIVAVIAAIVLIVGASVFALVAASRNGPVAVTPTPTPTSTPTPVTLLSQWQSNVSTMPASRYAFAAVTGPDGRIYAIGGYSGGSILNTVEAYNPKTNAWTALAPLSTARAFLAAVLGPDGRIYAIGGITNGGGALKTVEAYDVKANTWTAVADLSVPRYAFAAATGSDGRIYAIGGYNGSALKTVEAYNPKTNTWMAVADLLTARYIHTAAAGADGRIYVFGGYNSGALKSVEVYDFKANTWTAAADMPTARYGPAATLGADGRIYVLGGYNGGALSAVEFYDPKIKSWGSVASMPTSRYYFGAALGGDGRIYTLGGQSSSSVLNTVDSGKGSDW